MANYSIEAELKAKTSKYKRAIDIARKVTRRFKAESESVKDTELDADIKPLRRNIRKARKLMQVFTKSKNEVNIDADTSKATRKMGMLQAVKQALERRATIPVRVDIKKALKSLKTLTSKGKKAFNSAERQVQRFQIAINRMANFMQSFGVVTSSMIGGIALTFSSTLVPIIASLVPAIMAAGNALGVLAAGVAALGAGFGLAGVMALGFGAAAVPTITSIIDETAEATKENQKAAKQLKSLKSSWEGVQKAIAPNVAKAFTAAMSGVEKVVVALQPGLEKIGTYTRILSNRFDDFFDSKTASAFFEMFNKVGPMVFQNLGLAVGNFGKGIMTLLTAFGPAIQDASEGFQQMGSNFADWAAKVAQSDSLQKFVDYIKTNLPTVRGIFGDAFHGIINLFVAFSANSEIIFNALGQMMKRFRDWSATIAESDGFQKFIQYVQENGPKVIDLIGNVIGFIIQLGIALAPLGSKMLEVANGFLQWTTSMMQNHPIIGQLIGAATVLGGALLALIPFITMVRYAFSGIGNVISTVVVAAFNFLRAPIATMSGWFTRIAMVVGPIASKILPLLSRALLALTGPVGIIIGVLMLLVPVFVRLWQENEAFRNGVQTAWSIIQSVFETVINFISDLVKTVIGALVDWWSNNQETFYTVAQTVWDTVYNVISTILSTIWGFVKKVVSNIMDFWDKHGEFIMDVASAAWEMISSTISTVISIITSVIQGGLSIIQGIFQAVWPIISGIVEVAWGIIELVVGSGIDIISGLIDAGMSLLQGDWEAAWEAIKGIGEDIWNNLEAFFESVDLYDIGKNIIEGLIDGIKSMADGVIKAAKGVVDGAIEGAKNLLGIHSPSKVFDKFGVYTFRGWIRGAGRMKNKVANISTNMASVATKSFNPKMDMKSSQIASSLKGIKRNATAQVQNGINANIDVRKQPVEVNIYDNKEGVRAYVNEQNAIEATIRRYN